MCDTEDKRTVSAPVAGVVSYRRAIRDAEEERTVSAAVAGVAS